MEEISIPQLGYNDDAKCSKGAYVRFITSPYSVKNFWDNLIHRVLENRELARISGQTLTFTIINYRALHRHKQTLHGTDARVGRAPRPEPLHPRQS